MSHFSHLTSCLVLFSFGIQKQIFRNRRESQMEIHVSLLGIIFSLSRMQCSQFHAIKDHSHLSSIPILPLLLWAAAQTFQTSQLLGWRRTRRGGGSVMKPWLVAIAASFHPLQFRLSTTTRQSWQWIIHPQLLSELIIILPSYSEKKNHRIRRIQDSLKVRVFMLQTHTHSSETLATDKGSAFVSHQLQFRQIQLLIQDRSRANTPQPQLSNRDTERQADMLPRDRPTEWHHCRESGTKREESWRAAWQADTMAGLSNKDSPASCIVTCKHLVEQKHSAIWHCYVSGASSAWKENLICGHFVNITSAQALICNLSHTYSLFTWTQNTFTLICSKEQNQVLTKNKYKMLLQVWRLKNNLVKKAWPHFKIISKGFNI